MTTALPIGELRHRLVLERASTDAVGEIVWTVVDTVFAAIAPASAGETIAGATPTGTVSHRIEIRWRGDVTGRYRLPRGARISHIAPPRHLDNRHRPPVAPPEEEGR